MRDDLDRRTTGELIDDLVRDLAPVRRFPSMRVALAIVLAAWAAGALLSVVFHRPGLDLVSAITGDAFFASVVVGLVVAAVAGCRGAVDSMVPGREVNVGRAWRVAAAGIGLAVVAGVLAILRGADATAAPMAKDAGCFMLSVTIGAVPAIVLLVLARRGFVQYVMRSAAISLAGAFALGGLAVQLTCQQPGARHMLVGHVSVPLVVIGLATLPLAWLLARGSVKDRPPRRG